MNFNYLLSRENGLFNEDISNNEKRFREIIVNSSFLVIGAAGSIGQAVTKELFKRNPKVLHLVDLSENNLVEVVRQLRSTIGYIDGEFKTFAIDCGSDEYSALINSGMRYDFVLNLSAMKHVRSEKDPFTLMRMIRVNIFNTISTIRLAGASNGSKYFCVSTDKAANPVNMMGASKRIMEMFLARESSQICISTARFANVAFSDGSLLHGFQNRITLREPIAAPSDITRYFITPKESGELCLLSTLLAQNMETVFPKLSKNLRLQKFSSIAERYLESMGYEPYECSTEAEARARVEELLPQNKWPVYFFKSDTTGEKEFEEFFTSHEVLDLDRFSNVGIIKNDTNFAADKLEHFEQQIKSWIKCGHYDRSDLISLFNDTIENFDHKEKGKFLDNRM